MTGIKRYDPTPGGTDGFVERMSEAVDGDWIKHADHIAALEAVKATVKPARAAPVAWRARVGGQNLWSYAESEEDIDSFIKAWGVKEFEKEPLYTATERLYHG